MSRTNIELDDNLVNEALKLTHKKTKKDVVNYAMAELVQRLKRRSMLEIEGKVDWAGKLEDLRKRRI